MAFLSHGKKEIKAKIVYYGPGLSGKTSNIEFIHDKMRSDHRGDLVNLSTSDRTLFFDFLPVELGNIKGYRTRFHIFTVPGQVFYNETRRTVLKDVDGIVFVADSQKKMRDDNVRSLKNLEENLASYGKKLQEIPHVFQYNKRDLPDALTIEDLHRQLNKTNAPFFEAVAASGNGVLNTLKLISKMVLKKLATSSTEAMQESDAAFEENNYGLGREYEVVAPGAPVVDKETVVQTMELDIPGEEAVVEATPANEIPPAPAPITEAPPSGEANAPQAIEAAPVESSEPAVEVMEPITQPPPVTEHAENYEAEIQNELDESEIPTPPTREEEAALEPGLNPVPVVEAKPETVVPDEEIAHAEPVSEAEAIAESETIPFGEAEAEPVAEAELIKTADVIVAPNPSVTPQPVVAPPPHPIIVAEPTKTPGAKELVLYQWGFPERVGQSSIKIPIYFRDPQTQEEYWSYVTISLDNIFKRL